MAGIVKGLSCSRPLRGAQVGVMGNCPAKLGGTTAGAAGASWRGWCSRRQPAGCRLTAPGWTPQACSRSARSPRPSPPPCSRRLVYRLRGRQNHCDVQDPARILVAGLTAVFHSAVASGRARRRRADLVRWKAAWSRRPAAQRRLTCSGRRRRRGRWLPPRGSRRRRGARACSAGCGIRWSGRSGPGTAAPGQG